MVDETVHNMWSRDGSEMEKELGLSPGIKWKKLLHWTSRPGGGHQEHLTQVKYWKI